MALTLYWSVYPDATADYANTSTDAAKLAAGQDSTGAALPAGSYGSQAYSAAGVIDASTAASGLTAGTAYRIAWTIGDAGVYGGGTSTYVVISDPLISLALTGQGATASPGLLGAALSIPLTGQSGTFSAGTIIPSVALAAIGLQATGSLGSFSPTLSLALVGEGGTFSPGTLTPSSSAGSTVALTGEAAAFAQTTPSVSVTIALTGIAATMAAGLLSASSGTATITVKAGSWLRYKKLQ